MSRRQDREGVPRHAYQGHVNRKLVAAYVENERGWRIPNTVEDGWGLLNLSLWWLNYRVIWFATGTLTPQSQYEREEAWRNARIYLNEARACPAPSLPA